jgi:hypothetical protein
MNFFEQEFLHLLEKDLQKKIQEEGWGDPSDLEFKNYKKKLLQVKKGTLSLASLIAFHQDLFIKRGPVHLEKWLKKTFPKITGEIPLGKKGFSHLPSLKKCVSNKELFSLYENFTPKNPFIAILTWVQPDGLGDFYAAVEAGKILIEEIPDARIEMWMISKIPLPAETEFPVHRVEDCDEISLEEFKELRSTDFILVLPTMHPKMERIRDFIENEPGPQPRFECVGEYGFSPSDWFHPESGNHCLGLHFLEKGIFTRKEIKPPSFAKRGRFFLAYLHSSKGIGVYLTAILKYLETDSENITISFPDPARMYVFYKDREPFLKNYYGVSRVILHLKEHTISWDTAEKGKTLTLLCPESLKKEEYQEHLSSSEDFTACRGNQSFSECVSYGKAFFYEPRDHNRYFLKDLILIAKRRIKSFPSSIKTLELLENFLEPSFDEHQMGETIGILLQDKKTIAGLKKLSKILKAQWSCNSFLVNLAKRALFLREKTHFEKIEAEEMEPFYLGYKELAETLSNFKRSLSRELLDGK